MEFELDKTFRRISTLSGAILSFSIVISFFYDWGLFFALGISFAEAPTTISDHIRSWLVWLPGVTISILLIFIFELILLRLEKGMTEDEIIKSSSNPARTRQWRYSPFYFIVVTALIAIISWVLFGIPDFYDVIVWFVPFWFIFSAWIFSHPNVNKRMSYFLRRSIYFIPALLLIIFFSGLQFSKSNDIESITTHRLYIDNTENTLEYTDVELLRSFEEWLLIRAESKNISWIRLADISRMELMEERSQYQGLICILSGYWCLRGSHER